MNKKRYITMIIQLFVVILFAVGFFNYVHTKIKPTNVWVFKNDVKVNSQISMDDITQLQIPKSALTSNFILDSDEIVGKYAVTDMSADEYITNDCVVEKDKIDPFKDMDVRNLRKISLPIDYETGFAGNLKKGDKVDLIFTGKGEKNDQTFDYSKACIQGVYVWSVNTDEGYVFNDHSQIDTQTSNGDDGKDIETTDTSGKIANITLAVTLDQAEEITARRANGTIRIVGRFDNSENYQSLGYVLGDYSKVFTGNANAETSPSYVDTTSLNK